jgi:uncharacterized protein (DUF2267 family)
MESGCRTEPSNTGAAEFQNRLEEQMHFVSSKIREEAEYDLQNYRDVSSVLQDAIMDCDIRNVSTWTKTPPIVETLKTLR